MMRRRVWWRNYTDKWNFSLGWSWEDEDEIHLVHDWRGTPVPNSYYPGVYTYPSPREKWREIALEEIVLEALAK